MILYFIFFCRKLNSWVSSTCVLSYKGILAPQNLKLQFVVSPFEYSLILDLLGWTNSATKLKISNIIKWYLIKSLFLFRYTHVLENWTHNISIFLRICLITIINVSYLKQHTQNFLANELLADFVQQLKTVLLVVSLDKFRHSAIHNLHSKVRIYYYRNKLT